LFGIDSNVPPIPGDAARTSVVAGPPARLPDWCHKPAPAVSNRKTMWGSGLGFAIHLSTSGCPRPMKRPPFFTVPPPSVLLPELALASLASASVGSGRPGEPASRTFCNRRTEKPVVPPGNLRPVPLALALLPAQCSGSDENLKREGLSAARARVADRADLYFPHGLAPRKWPRGPANESGVTRASTSGVGIRA